jgi:hypothetical protein
LHGLSYFEPHWISWSHWSHRTRRTEKLASECTAETWSLVSHASSLLTSPTSHRPTYPSPTHRTQNLRTMALDTSVTQSSRLQCEAVSFIQPIPMPVRLKISTDAIERPKVIPFNSCWRSRATWVRLSFGWQSCKPATLVTFRAYGLIWLEITPNLWRQHGKKGKAEWRLPACFCLPSLKFSTMPG